ncbi:PAS domain-containing protein, partial [Methylomonas koyamae]|uniref:PAS domain-containing protein n=1 Tax=Methylomonas koyamae TaxID=702114 RepID=UPI0012F686E2
AAGADPAPSSLALCRAALARARQRDAAECFEAELVARNHSFQALVTASSLPPPRPGAGKALLLIQAIDPASDFLVMRRVIEQSASAMMVTDASGRIVYVNPRFSALSGYAEAELLGQNPNLLQSGKMSQQDYQELWRQLAVSGEWQGEICNRHKNGREYWVAESISAIKDSRATPPTIWRSPRTLPAAEPWNRPWPKANSASGKWPICPANGCGNRTPRVTTCTAASRSNKSWG